MEKLTKDDSTILFMTGEEAMETCKLGQQENCCPWLVVGVEFECWKNNVPSNARLAERIRRDSMTAKGKGCNWNRVAGAATQRAEA